MLLETQNLKVALDAEAGLVQAVDGLSLAIERGETFALVGESGCGKSMTALALMRLLPDNGCIMDGHVLWEGQDLLSLPESSMRQWRGARLAMVFQDPSTSLNPVMRVGDQIVETIRTHTSLRGVAARNKALEWLTRVGIPEPERRIDSFPFQLSGGQKQRVMIAMALAAEPDLLIADEPTTALDVTIQAQILALLRILQAELGMAILLITHDLGVVAQMAHRVALMYAGQIIEVAETRDFFERPLHPYARQLLAALPEQAKRGHALASIPGTVPPLTQRFTGCRFADRCAQVMPHCAVTPPALVAPMPAHTVRCLLYETGQLPQQVLTSVAVPDLPGAPEAATPGQAVLRVRELRVHFPIRSGLLKRTTGYVKAVDGIDFAVRSGQTLALVGESGCGKTSVAKALVQLLRGIAHTAGEALLDGQDLMHLQGPALLEARRAMQIVFQDPYGSLDPRMRAGDSLEEGLLSLRPEWSAAERSQRIAHMLDKVGLAQNVVSRYPHEFSGGQRQRLAIARALVVEPRLVICDEPTSALDVSVQAQILNLLRALQLDLGVSYLFITHNFGVVQFLADEVAVMRHGRIVEMGEATQVLNQPNHPYTRELLAAVPTMESRFRAEA